MVCENLPVGSGERMGDKVSPKALTVNVQSKFDQRRAMSEETTAKCLECGATSDQKVLLSCVKDDSPTWVCVHCLPILIHGAH